jgi:hypothetical protein
VIYTPKEAPKIWCPHVRYVDGYTVTDAAAVNADRDGAHRVQHYNDCIADRCSQWRWWWQDLGDSVDRRGYCGLAGEPDAV